MRELETFTGKLVRYELKHNSVNGNPRYYGVFESEDGRMFYGTTASDAACGCGFLNKRNEVRTLQYHTTKSGNNIIDYITIGGEE